MHWSKQSGCGCQCALGELVRVIKEEGENVCSLSASAGARPWLSSFPPQLPGLESVRLLGAA